MKAVVQRVNGEYFLVLPTEVVESLKIKDGDSFDLTVQEELCANLRKMSPYEALIGDNASNERVPFVWDRIPEEEPPF